MAQLVTEEIFAILRSIIAFSYEFLSVTSGGRREEMGQNELCNVKERFGSLRYSSTSTPRLTQPDQLVASTVTDVSYCLVSHNVP